MESEGLVRDDYVSVDGLRLHYREWGEPNAPDLLILHGLTGHAREFDGIARSLSADFHVVVLDQRGHGDSEWAPSYTPDVMSEDIATVLKTLELTPARIVGHSMGGIIAWTCAARYPDLVDRLVIIDVGPDSLEPEEVQNTWLETLEHAQRATYADPEGAVTEYLAGRTVATTDPLRQFVLHNLRQREDGDWVWRYDTGGLKLLVTSARASANHWETLRQIACPTLLVRAGESGALSTETAERMSTDTPRARYVEIPQSGHDVHIDQPEPLLRELQAFLDVG